MVGGFGRRDAGNLLMEALDLPCHAGLMYARIEELYDEAKPDVVVDFTVPPVASVVVEQAVDRGISPVIGSTGWDEETVERLRRRCETAALGALLVPNFAIGAVLMMQFAEKAARFFEKEEIVEVHHPQKRDAPSGTAKLTAARIERAAGRSVPMHSLRLPGAVAHQEVIFGALGEMLTVRHDSLSRDGFTRGVVLAVRRVRDLRGLVIGLDSLLESA